MVLLHSEKKAIGSPAPPFALSSVDGKKYSLTDFASKKVLVIAFICNHCPYVKAIEERLITLAHAGQEKGVQWVGICSNDPTDYPDDKPESLLKRWREKKYGFPYLIDESQDIARAYGAVCTPDIFVYDEKRRLAYHGRLDDNWQEPEKVMRQDLREAIEKLLSGRRPTPDQYPSMGCSIKWKQKN